jgi:hypothetical protein
LVFASDSGCVTKSRMNGDVHVRFCERLGAKIPRSTRLSQTPSGAHASAALYSLVETAKANGIDPFSYLSLIFKELPKATGISDYEKLLPYHVAQHYELTTFTRPQ